MQKKGIHTKKPSLIFDFGGVLLDWDPRNLFQKYFGDSLLATDKFIAEIDFYAWNLEQDKGRLFADGVAELSARFPQYAHLIKAYDEFWEESIRGPINPTVCVLQSLKQKGYQLYGLTNFSLEKFQLVSERYPFINIFEDILVSGAVKLAKPDPRIFQLMLERISRPARECVFIDDSAVNVSAARDLGFHAIHFQSARQMLVDLDAIIIACN